MSEKKIFKNDVGIVFRVYAGVDLSDATSLEFDVKKPDGSIETWNASIDPTNYFYATYTTVDGDLDIAGDWKISLQMHISTGNKVFTGQSDKFKVYEQFEDDCYKTPY